MEEGNNEDSLDIFRRLMNLDPFFLEDNFGDKYGLDAFKVGDWFDKNSKKFPEEFDWWFKEIKKDEK